MAVGPTNLEGFHKATEVSWKSTTADKITVNSVTENDWQS